MKKPLFFAAALTAALAASARAQVTINAEVSKTEVSSDEQLTLAVTVAGPDSNLPEPHIPPLNDLSVYDSGRSQSLSIVNGQVSSSIVYTYVAIPRKTGKLVVPPISVTYQGRTVQTQPIDIMVRKGAPVAPGSPGRQAPGSAAAPSARGGKEFFVSADVDKKKAYVNEQLTLSVHVCTAADLLQGPQYDPPSLSGFLAEDLPPPERQANMTVRGRPYHCWEIKTALFPAQAGRLTVGAARAQVVLVPRLDDMSGDIFQRFFQQGAGGRAVEDRSEPIVIAAEPLPEAGKPAGFSGSVGQYFLSAAVDRTRVKAGEAVNLTLTVTGQGNLKTVGAPTLPDLPSLRVFDTVSSLSLDKRGDVVRGAKVFKTVLVPKVSGPVAIPPIRLDFFDPAARAYRHAESAPIRLEVAPGEGGETASGPAASTPRGVTAVSQDLRYLMAAPRRGTLTAALEALASAGWLNAAPFLVFFGAFGWTEWKRREGLDPAGARARSARRAAQERLRQARQVAADPGASAARLSEAFTGYLADKLGQPASGLTLKRAQELLRQRRPDAPAELLDQVKELWDELDMRRFAPTAAGESAVAVADRVDALLERLDKEVLR